MTSLEQTNRNTEFSWVKAHVGIVGNKLANQLAKAATSDSDAKIVFNRLPMSTLISEIEEQTKQKWQKEWEECTKAEITKVFSKGARQAKVRNRYNPNPHSGGDGPWGNQGLPPLLQNSATCKLPLQQQGSNCRPYTKSVFNTAYTKRNTQTQCLKVWELPVSKYEIITKHLKSFLMFIKSINFDKM